MNAVDEAKKVIEKLPKDSSWEQIMYKIYVKQKIEKGLQADKNGKLISHEDIKKKFGVK